MLRGGIRAGAGRPPEYRKVENCRFLDIRQLQRWGILTSPWQGQWRWLHPRKNSVLSALSIFSYRDGLQLTYVSGKNLIEEALQVERTRCSLGGSRPWFVCPSCRRRAVKLYLRDSKFRCRICQGLRYTTQSMVRVERLRFAISKLEGQLSPHWCRPIGMHHSTRKELIERIIALEEVLDDKLYASLYNSQT